MRRPIEIFSVGTDFIQVIVRIRGRHEIRIGTDVRWINGPIAAATFSGLSPSTHYAISIDGHSEPTATTLNRPSGALLARVATVSDTHIGETGFLHWPRITSQTDPRRYEDAHPVWALRAAAAEIREWGPDVLVAKGDLSHRDRSNELQLAIEILQSSGVPLIGEQGNHDGGNHLSCDTLHVVEDLGLAFDQGVVRHRIGGADIVTVASTVVGASSGSVKSNTDAAAAALDPDTPALVLLHHQFARWPFNTYIPVGIHKGEGDAFLRRISGTSRRVLVSSGHSHRNRLRRFGGIPVTEVGSTKDYPGVWAMYEIYEGGIVQTLRRIADERVLEWTEGTRRAMFRAWGLWSPGRLKDRSLTHTW